MGNLDKEIKDLLDRTAQTRYEFLNAELQTCFTALDMAKHEISARNFEVAKKEIASVEAGARTLQRFLPDVPAQQRVEIENKAANLQALLAALKVQLNEQQPR